MKNTSPSLWLKNFGAQHRTPKSAANVAIDERRKKLDSWRRTGGKREGSQFFTQKEMSELRHQLEINNSKRRRGEGNYELNYW